LLLGLRRGRLRVARLVLGFQFGPDCFPEPWDFTLQALLERKVLVAWRVRVLYALGSLRAALPGVDRDGVARLLRLGSLQVCLPLPGVDRDGVARDVVRHDQPPSVKWPCGVQ